MSRAFNRALGSILSAGDMFGGIGGGSGRSLPGEMHVTYCVCLSDRFVLYSMQIECWLERSFA